MFRHGALYRDGPARACRYHRLADKPVELQAVEVQHIVLIDRNRALLIGSQAAVWADSQVIDVAVADTLRANIPPLNGIHALQCGGPHPGTWHPRHDAPRTVDQRVAVEHCAQQNPFGHRRAAECRAGLDVPEVFDGVIVRHIRSVRVSAVLYYQRQLRHAAANQPHRPKHRANLHRALTG